MKNKSSTLLETDPFLFGAHHRGSQKLNCHLVWPRRTNHFTNAVIQTVVNIVIVFQLFTKSLYKCIWHFSKFLKAVLLFLLCGLNHTHSLTSVSECQTKSHTPQYTQTCLLIKTALSGITFGPGIRVAMVI